MGSDFTDNRFFKAYWLCLYAFVFGNLVWYRFARPLRAFARYATPLLSGLHVVVGAGTYLLVSDYFLTALLTALHI